jgi:SAM-dependent methyltransferase
MENIFESAAGKEFIDADNRKDRTINNVSAESQFNRLSVQMPQWLIQDKTVLDLGSCLGAAGYFALSSGASHYTGVEIQDTYYQKSKDLLSKNFDSNKFAIVKDEIESFLDNAINNKQKYDVVLIAGVLYAFLNVFSLLEKVSKVTTEAVIIDTVWMEEYDKYQGVILFNGNTRINYADDNKSFRGLGTRVSPKALDVIMSQFSFFNKEKFLMPVRVTSGYDSYHDIRKYTGYNGPSRFTVRYFKSIGKTDGIREMIANNDTKSMRDFLGVKLIESNVDSAWKFDDSVAKRFQQEANQHIPDYARVIQMCIDIASKTISKDDNVIDVGSALGYTINKFIESGYTNVYGVEASDSMIANTQHPNRVFKSDIFPEGKFQFVMINWTLHFVFDKLSYLQRIFDNTASGATVIISDKTVQTPAIKELYYQFKRDNGVDQSYIEAKEKQLNGVMHTMPVSWYVTHLESIGFTDIEIINSRFGFVTYMCRKP